MGKQKKVDPKKIRNEEFFGRAGKRGRRLTTRDVSLPARTAEVGGNVEVTVDNAPARGLFFLLLFLWASKEKVNPSCKEKVNQSITCCKQKTSNASRQSSAIDKKSPLSSILARKKLADGADELEIS